MKKLLIALLFVPSIALANNTAHSTNDSHSRSTANNQIANAPIFQNTNFNVGRLNDYQVGDVRCNEAGVGFGGGYQSSNALDGGLVDSSSAMVSFVASTDKIGSWITGEPTKCEKAVAANIKRKKMELNFAIIQNCIAAAQAGIILDYRVEGLEWAEVCRGVRTRQEVMMFKK